LIDSLLFPVLRRWCLGAVFFLSIFLVSGMTHSQGQTPPQSPLYGGSSASNPPQQQSGSATAGEFAPVLDSEKRPITAGGFVKSGPVIFQDISQKAGLTAWQHKMGTPQKPYILETIGSGVALLDYDHDGWLDIYMVNGSTYDALDGKTEPPHAALFHNNHDGTFTEVAARAGVTNDRWGFGVAVGDYDNEGWPDLYVGNYGRNRLYHNNHDGTFTDVAEVAGATGQQDGALATTTATGDWISSFPATFTGTWTTYRFQGTEQSDMRIARFAARRRCAALAGFSASPISCSTTTATAPSPM
jgi:hypothetical protein